MIKLKTVELIILSLGMSSSPNAGGISARFNYVSIADVYWLCGFFLSVVCVIIAFILFCLIIHTFYWGKLFSMKNALTTKQQQNDYFITKLSATLSATFSLWCAALICASFPICTTYDCGYDFIGNFFYCVVLDTYVLSKISTYTLFIGRIYNDYYKMIYSYSNHILYLLLFMIFIVFITLITLNLASILNFQMHHVFIITIISVLLFTLFDFMLSVCTLFLFIRPLYLYSNDSKQSPQSHQHMKDQVIKYVLLSIIAIISSLIYEISYSIRVFLGIYHSYSNKTNDELDVSSIFQMVDCVISMFCVYFGFVSGKITFDKYCNKCDLCFRNIYFKIYESILQRNRRRKTTALRALYKDLVDPDQLIDNYSDDQRYRVDTNTPNMKSFQHSLVSTPNSIHSIQ